MQVEVAYATPEKQMIIAVDMPVSSTAEQAIVKSGVIQQFPEIDLQQQSIGIFSKRATLETILREGDRVEIYRPLQVDPKTARRLRAERGKKK